VDARGICVCCCCCAAPVCPAAPAARSVARERGRGKEGEGEGERHTRQSERSKVDPPLSVSLSEHFPWYPYYVHKCKYKLC
jgi:hypothetical protein